MVSTNYFDSDMPNKDFGSALEKKITNDYCLQFFKRFGTFSVCTEYSVVTLQTIKHFI